MILIFKSQIKDRSLRQLLHRWRSYFHRRWQNRPKPVFSCPTKTESSVLCRVNVPSVTAPRSSAAMQPLPALVTAWRYTWSCHVAGGKHAGRRWWRWRFRRDRRASRCSRSPWSTSPSKMLSILGVWPMAMNTALDMDSSTLPPLWHSSRGHRLTPLLSPRTSSRVCVSLESTLPCLALSSRRLGDQNLLGPELVPSMHHGHRAWRYCDRYSASSTAVFPPPTTATVLVRGRRNHRRWRRPRRLLPMNSSSDGDAQVLRALAPVAMISASQV